MKVYKCDRCGAVFNREDMRIRIDNATAENPVYNIDIREEGFFPRGHELHLCNDCHAKLVDFMNPKPFIF